MRTLKQKIAHQIKRNHRAGKRAFARRAASTPRRLRERSPGNNHRINSRKIVSFSPEAIRRVKTSPTQLNLNNKLVANQRILPDTEVKPSICEPSTSSRPLTNEPFSSIDSMIEEALNYFNLRTNFPELSPIPDSGIESFLGELHNIFSSETDSSEQLLNAELHELALQVENNITSEQFYPINEIQPLKDQDLEQLLIAELCDLVSQIEENTSGEQFHHKDLIQSLKDQCPDNLFEIEQYANYLDI